MFTELFLKDFKNEIPTKCEVKIRSESFGKTLFNPDTLKHIYIDNCGYEIFNSIDGNKNVGELFNIFCNKNKGLKIISCVIFLKYLSYFQNEGFISMNKKLPNLNVYDRFKDHPLISAPNHISWIITNQCNLRCSHCANKNSFKCRNELTTQEALKFVEECANYGVFILNISGGEPFIRKDLFKILSHARKLGIEIGITTNGTLIDEKTAKKLKFISPFNVHISVDGVGDVHDKFRNKKGVFKRVLRTIKLFKKYEIPFGITTSISKMNINDLENIKEFVKKEKIVCWEIYYAIPLGNLKKEFSLSRTDLVGLAKTISEYKEELKNKCSIFVGDSLGYFCKYNIRDDEWIGCLAGLNHCAIGPEGEIKGCPIQPDEFIEGNIRNGNFIEIWRDKKSFIYNRKPIPLEKHCKRCKYSHKCKGGCKTSMFVQNKKLTYNDLCIRHIEGLV